MLGQPVRRGPRAIPDPQDLPAWPARPVHADRKDRLGRPGRKARERQPVRLAPPVPRSAWSAPTAAGITAPSRARPASHADRLLWREPGSCAFRQRATGVLSRAQGPGQFSHRRLRQGSEEVSGAARVPTRPSPAPAAHGAAGGVPNFDIRSSCRDAESAVSGTPSNCLADEELARGELTKSWGRYPSTERSRCAELSGMKGFESYVELLTCLEMATPATTGQGSNR